MNIFQSKLYENLISLCADNETFFFVDQTLDDIVYRIFNYRMASYTDFSIDGALECRGIMYEINSDGNAVRLASLPFQKFFNLYENPFTMDLDLSTIVEIADKADGSLITTFLHDGQLRVKSKGSLASDQAVAANAWLLHEDNLAFRNELFIITRGGNTVIMEWCALDNRIVLPYMKSHLKVLGMRCHTAGEIPSFCDIDGEHFSEVLTRWTKIYNIDDKVKFINDLPEEKNIEGVVFELESGQRVKVKTTWYMALHHTKDSINTPRRLFEAVVEEATDDMRSLFHDDPLAIQLITEMETFVEVRYNHMVDGVERFCKRNKELIRKDFAILGQEELDRTQFGLAMKKYSGQEVDYKAAMKKRWKSYGLKDEK